MRIGTRRQVIKGVIAGTVVGVPLAAYLVAMLNALPLFAALAGLGMASAILAVVGTRTAREDAAADLAWRAAAPDLPPASDRRVIEELQVRMAGPESRPARPARHGSRTENR